MNSSNYLLDNLNEIKRIAKFLRPADCCPGVIMHLNDGREVTCCSNDCEWQELDRLIATCLVDAELRESKING